MTELHALIFDVDGTLANTERDGHRVAFNRAFAEAGLDWHWSVSFYGELLAVAGGKERIRFYLNHYRSDFPPTANLDRLSADLHAAKTKHYQELLASGAIPLRPGVERLLKEARRQEVRLAIATTSALPNVTALLEKNLEPSWFELIVAGDIVPAKKPAPDIYHYVLEVMELQAQDCLVFEDSHHGLKASSQVGLKTVVTFNDYTKNQDFADAILVVNNLGEPEQPFTVVSGDVGDVSYLDMSLVRRLHAGIRLGRTDE